MSSTLVRKRRVKRTGMGGDRYVTCVLEAHVGKGPSEGLAARVAYL